MSAPLYPTPEVILPAELEESIRHSVATFREQWGMMSAYAISMGYIDKYRTELHRIAELAYKTGAREAQPSETAETSASPKSE